MKYGKKKGVALLWAVILSAVLIIIATTMVNYIIKESEFSIKTGDSAQAYSYAKSGIEWANKQIKEQPLSALGVYEFDWFGSDGSQLSDGLTDIKVTLTKGSPISLSCTALYCIRSTGYKGNVTRTLEYEASTPNINHILTSELDDNTPVSGISVGNSTESFEIGFNFWGSHSMMFGLNNSNIDTLTTNYLSMEIRKPMGNTDANRKDYVYISARGQDSSNTSVIRSAQLLKSNGDPFTLYTEPEKTERLSPYQYLVKIKYIKDTAAKITLYRRGVSAGEETLECRGSATLDLRGINLGNLNSLFYIDDPEDAYAPTSAITIARYRKNYFHSCPSSIAGNGDGSYIVVSNTVPTIAVCPWMFFDNLTIKK